MCHFILLLPVVALPVFWIMPLALALSVYGAVLIFSCAIYWHAVQAIKRPVLTGAEGMIGQTAEIVEERGRYIVARLRNELWRAACESSLSAGDKVTVVAVERLTLRVQKLDARAADLRGVAQPPTANGSQEFRRRFDSDNGIRRIVHTGADGLARRYPCAIQPRTAAWHC